MTEPAVQVAFYRTLYSQSGASVTAGCVAAALTAAGCSVHQVLLTKGSHHNARTLLADRPGPRPILLFKPNFQDVAESLAMVDALRSAGAYSGLYLFGVYATLNGPELLKRFPAVDGVLLGEPEPAAVELWRQSIAGQGPGSVRIPGVLARQADGRLVDGGPGPVPSLENYTWPRRDIEKQERAALANLEASRGCIAACTFCHVPVFEAAAAAPRRRVRPVADVVDEMVHLYRDLGKRYLIFNDGLFWSGPRDDERLDELVRLLRSRTEWQGEFMIYLRTNPMLTSEQLADLSAVGLIRVFIGVESESDETLKIYRKGARGDAYDGVKKVLRDAGVSHHIGFLMFHPFVRVEQVRRDVEFLYRHDQLHRLGVIIEPARLIPGSGLKQQALSAGLLRDADPLTGDEAYGYEFADPEAGWVFRQFRRLVRDSLNGRHRALEYFHTSAEFLEFALQRRLGPDHPLASRPAGLTDARSELRELVHSILSRLLELAGRGADTADGARTEVDGLAQEAATSLRRVLARTEPVHALWFDHVRSSEHHDLVAAMFTSEEGVR